MFLFHYSLKEKLLEETPLPLLHLFTTNVLIFVQASMKDSNLCHTSSFKSLISSERKRMNLIERLWIALKVSAKINDHCLSLQVVVLLYVLLVPFIQEFTSNNRIIEVSTRIILLLLMLHTCTCRSYFYVMLFCKSYLTTS